MNVPLTAGAWRALDLAQRIAGRVGAGEVLPGHVLWGLVLDGSRAAAMLARQGLTEEWLREYDPLPEEQGEDQSETLPTETQTALPRSVAVEEMLVVARSAASSSGAGEVGTEHLLTGLLQVDSPVRRWLRDLGVGKAVTEESEAVQGPLTPDAHVRVEPVVSDQTDTYRILDASGNRLREGLRVLEDFVRFSLDDRHLTERLKLWRHDFTSAFRMISPAALLAARETQGDVGTTIQTSQERHRGSLIDVVQAGFKRVQEAARTLEEYGKLVDADFAAALGRLRYDFYVLEKSVLRTQSARERLADRRLYLLVSEELCPHGVGPMLRQALAGGVDVVQVREKRMPDRQLLEHARRVREWTHQAGALFIMNDRPDLAVLADADGVHVGQEELTVRDVRRIVGPDRLVGVSTHTLLQARQAVLDGADYLGVGPVFPSGTKAFTEFAGLEFVREVAVEISLPWFAIGGITEENVSQVMEGGATRVAVSGAICRAADPWEASRGIRERLQKAALAKSSLPRAPRDTQNLR